MAGLHPLYDTDVRVEGVMFWRRAATRAGSVAPLLTIAACALTALPSAACLNDGTPTPCRCVMKLMVKSAAAQSFTSASPTLSSSFGVAAAPQTVHVGTDTSTGFTHYYYNAPDITVNVGDTVTWQLDQADQDHTVSSDLPANDPQYFDSGSMVLRGGTYDHTFLAPGVYRYHCVIHDFIFNGQWSGEQIGTVTVVPEPTTAIAAIVLGTGAMLRRRRRA